MEREFLRELRRRLPGHPQLIVPPGDDAAVLRLLGSDVVVTVDLLSDAVDFVVGRDDPKRIGRKCLAVNLSDLAAMAARPLAAFVAVALPRHGARELAERLLAGMLPLADEFGLAIAGGDTNTHDGPLVVSVTLLGEPSAAGPLLRSGARPGDRLLATGWFGGSILGHQFDFQPRVREALLLSKSYVLHAGIDVSDGLSIDAAHLADESGCGVALELARIPLAPAAHEAAARPGDHQSALDHALGDGEDFELLLAMPADEAQRLLNDQPLDVPLTEIGRFVEAAGLWQVRDDGQLQPLAVQGWEHQAAPPKRTL